MWLLYTADAGGDGEGGLDRGHVVHAPPQRGIVVGAVVGAAAWSPVVLVLQGCCARRDM